MKPWGWFAAGAALVPSSTALAAPSVRACTDPPRVNDAEWAIERTVRVETPDGVGSGVFVSPDGFVLTAAHVVEGEDWVTVVLADGGTTSGRVVRVSPATDLALLATRELGAGCMPVRLTPPKVGTEVVAIGSPGGRALPMSVSRGVVSGIRQVGGVEVVQTDASINPGNSGGPLVGEDGDLVGIVSYKLVAEDLEGLGFASSAARAASSLDFGWGEVSDKDLLRHQGAPTRVVLRAVEADADEDHDVAYGPWQRRPHAAVRVHTGSNPDLYGASGSLYLPRPLALEVGISRQNPEIGTGYARVGIAHSLREPRTLGAATAEYYHRPPRYPAFDVLVQPMAGARYTEDHTAPVAAQWIGANGVVAVDLMIWFDSRAAFDVRMGTGGTWWVVRPVDQLAMSPELQLACGMSF